MNKKQKILVFVDWYLPGFKAGGPIQSIANMVENLKQHFDFAVVTTNKDLGASKPYDDIESDKWLKWNGVSVYYFSHESLSYFTVKRIIIEQNADIIYLNSFFSFYFSIIPLLISNRNKLKCKIILCPRGMLGKGSLAIKSAKKKLFMTISKLVGLHKKVFWHATNPSEEEDTKAIFGNDIDLAIAPNFSKKSNDNLTKRKKQRNGARFVFLGRVSPVKNVLQAIRCFKNTMFTRDIVFDIYGPIEDELYFKECKQLIEQLPKNITVSFKGVLEPNKINRTLSSYHFFLFLTLNENFGHAIIEALSAGCPAIISNQTPWQDLEQKKAGWVRPLDHDFDIILEKCISLNQEDYDEMSHAAHNYAMGITNNKLAVEQHLKLFSNSTFV